MVALQLRLQDRGARIVEDARDAEVVIVNTCAVTAGTESKTRRLVRSISREAPGARILVTGCLAQKQPAEFRGKADWIVGNVYKDEIVSILDKGDSGVFHSGFDVKTIPPVVPAPRVAGGAFRTRFPVKIQEGCNFRCAYCIVPQLRGPSRSAPFSRVIETCREVVGHGYKELVLTGTHIGQYGNGEQDLPALIDAILAISGDFRVRLSSLDPRDISEEMVSRIVSDERICKHIHVSFQSFSPEVLRMMARSAEHAERALELLYGMRKKYPWTGMGADIIVGFPGESEKMFETTCSVLQTLGLSYGHVFRYSRRPGTAASRMKNHVPEHVKTARSALVRTIVEQGRLDFQKACDMRAERIIVEQENPVRGVTSNYLRVEIPDCKAQCNAWLDISLINEHRGRYSSGRPIRSIEAL